MELVKALDIMLDPFYFGMGNTFYQAMALNTPVVTMPTNHMKSKHAFAAYKQMGIKNAPVAKSPDDYITICKKLVCDKSYMESIKKQINNESRDRIFNDKDIHREYINFIKSSLDAAKKDSMLTINWRPKKQLGKFAN